jgi:hypothetical protein
MMLDDKKSHQEKPNHYFILKCLAVLGAAALASTAIIAIMTSCKGASVSAIFATKTLAATSTIGASAIAISPVFAILGAALLIGAILLLPWLLSRANRSVTRETTNPAYRTGWWPSFWAPRPMIPHPVIAIPNAIPGGITPHHHHHSHAPQIFHPHQHNHTPSRGSSHVHGHR